MISILDLYVKGSQVVQQKKSKFDFFDKFYDNYGVKWGQNEAKRGKKNKIINVEGNIDIEVLKLHIFM